MRFCKFALRFFPSSLLLDLKEIKEGVDVDKGMFYGYETLMIFANKQKHKRKVDCIEIQTADLFHGLSREMTL